MFSLLGEFWGVTYYRSPYKVGWWSRDAGGGAVMYLVEFGIESPKNG